MRPMRQQDEDIGSILENGNFFGPGKDSNEAFADVQKEISALRMLLIGSFLCFYLGEIIQQFLVIASAGSLFMLVGALWLRNEQKQFRAVMLLSVLQTLWRIALVICSYIPQTYGNAVLLICGYVFAGIGFVQLILLHCAFIKSEWIALSVKIPVKVIGFLVLVLLNLFQGTAIFVLKIVVGILVALYLHYVFSCADIENA